MSHDIMSKLKALQTFMAKAKILEPVETKIDLKVAKSFDPKKYFKDGKGLWVSSSFEERIRDKAPTVATAQKFELSSFTLLKNSSDKDIEAALPEKHIFSESEVCAVVAALIDKQPKGKEGALLNNGYANLFYTASFVVHVRWDSDDGHWHVSTWSRGYDWHADSRVFSPATSV